MTTVWTQEADARLRDYLASHELVDGIGTEESACSIAAINLALTAELTDTIPKCMSKVDLFVKTPRQPGARWG